MKRIFTSFLILSFLGNQVFGAECTLDTVPAPPIEAFAKNVDKILEAAEAASADTICVRPADSSSHLNVAIPAQSVRGLLNALSAVGYDLKSLMSDIRYYFDTSDIPPLQQTYEHQNTLLEIQGKILDASARIGSKCAQGIVRFDEDVVLDGGATYKTKGRLMQDVLVETYDQTKHVIIFFRNLVTNVSDREYIDETHFTIAPVGFAGDMRDFFSSQNIQACHDQEPRNQKIKELTKEAFKAGWKYPQAIQIWKEAFQLLLYRTGQVLGSDEVDLNKEAQIKSIVEAQKGGIGNSRFLINRNNLKELMSNPSDRSVGERAKEVAKRIAYEVFGSIFYRQVIPDVRKENSTSKSINVPKFPTANQDGLRLASIDKSLYSDYAARKELVSQNKAQDPRTVVGLVQALEQLEQARPIIEEIAKLICKLYGRQATNVPRPTCQELFNM